LEPALYGIGGGAFTSTKAFEAICQKLGIRRPLTAPYEPQQVFCRKKETHNPLNGT